MALLKDGTADALSDAELRDGKRFTGPSPWQSDSYRSESSIQII